MKTIININDFWYEVTQLTKKHSKGKHPKLRISSFGIFSSPNNSMVRKYFDLLQSFKYDSVEIVIGMAKYNPCKKDCLDCYNKYCRAVQAVNKLMAAYPFLKSRLVYETHLKLFIASSSLGQDCIVGGINFGDSTWTDSAVVLPGKNAELESVFDYALNFAPQFDFVPKLVPDEREYGVINFGRHKGKTWAQVNIEAPQYIEWAKRENIKIEL